MGNPVLLAEPIKGFAAGYAVQRFERTGFVI
jgi:hypothetical protein